MELFVSSQGALWDNIDAVNGAAQQGRKDYKCTTNFYSTAEGSAAVQKVLWHCDFLVILDSQMHFYKCKDVHIIYLNVRYCHNYNDYTIAHNSQEDMHVVCSHQIKNRESFR